MLPYCCYQLQFFLVCNIVIVVDAACALLIYVLSIYSKLVFIKLQQINMSLRCSHDNLITCVSAIVHNSDKYSPLFLNMLTTLCCCPH